MIHVLASNLLKYLRWAWLCLLLKLNRRMNKWKNIVLPRRSYDSLLVLNNIAQFLGFFKGKYFCMHYDNFYIFHPLITFDWTVKVVVM